MRRAVVAAAAAVFAPLAAGQGYAAKFEAQCVACHGTSGRSTMATVPSLAGQPSFYAITQLFLFRQGRRNDHPMSPAMSALAQGMSDDDLRGYSAHIATLPPPAPAAGGDAARVERGRVLAEAKHCTGCHGRDLAGGQQVPRLAHQREDYLQIALRGFRAGTRLGYTQAMNEALSGLTPEQLDDLAHALAHWSAK